MRVLSGVVAGTFAGAAVVAVMIGPGFVNYDTLFNLSWGDQVAHGENPVLALPIAPTSKPLVIAAGSVLAPLGHAGQDVVTAGALFALGLLATACFLLARHVSGRAAGIVAAAIVLTREPVLSFGVRAYIDVPYAALVLLAVVVGLRRPAAFRLVLALLGLAGLLRPEAWLFSVAYVVVLARTLGGRALVQAVALAALAPGLWATSDLVLEGHPLFSLVGTRGNAEVLDRSTGIASAVTLAPRRLGEIVREPVLLAATGGLLLCVRGRLPDGRAIVAALATGMAAFAVLAAAGMPVLGRYLLLVATIVIVLAAIGAVEGVRLAWGGDRRWAAYVAAVLVCALASSSAQTERLDRLRGTIRAQAVIADDLHALADGGALSACARLRAPNHRLRPMLAAWLHRPPESVAAGGPIEGVAVLPATRRVARLFILDPRDRVPTTDAPLAGTREAEANRSWRVVARCPTG